MAIKFQLKKLTLDIGYKEYEMYQDIENIKLRSLNPILNKSYFEYKQIIKQYIKEEIEINIDLQTTTNRYILYVFDNPVGEFGIRTTLNDFWVNNGSQIFYKIRKPEYGKGYGNVILELGLEECRKLGFKRIRVNCEDSNIPSKKMLIRVGAIVDKHYENSNGKATSYIINL